MRHLVLALFLLGLPVLPAHAQEPSPAPQDDAAKLKEKLSKAVQVMPFVAKDGTVTLYYALQERKEAVDFKARGFDKCEVNTVHVPGRDKVTGLEIGAGSRGMGTALHKLGWEGDFEIKFSVQILASPKNAVFCVLLGKKVGALWGQRLVKARGFRPLTKTGKLDRTVFKEGRVVEISLVREGAKLSVSCDGLPTDSHEFKKGELDGIQIGFAAKNVRLVATNWSFKGKVVEKTIK